MKFVPLKLSPRHCSVVLANSDLGDIVLSVTAFVNKPVPILPEALQQHHSTVVDLETRTLHLNTASNLEVEENIIIRNCNISLENALLEVSKWELDEQDVKRTLLAESLHYAALSYGFTKLHLNDFLEIWNSGPEETIVFSVESSNQKQFTMPKQVNVPTAGTGR